VAGRAWSAFYAERLCAVRFGNKRGRGCFSRKELSASRSDSPYSGAYSGRAPQRHPVRSYPPRSLFRAARSFQLLPFGFPFGAVLLHEKRSAVSFPPDVAPSKDTGDHWTLLHEIHTVACVRLPPLPSRTAYVYIPHVRTSLRTVIDIRL